MGKGSIDCGRIRGERNSGAVAKDHPQPFVTASLGNQRSGRAESAV
jgi:hypothetical protein